MKLEELIEKTTKLSKAMDDILSSVFDPDPNKLDEAFEKANKVYKEVTKKEEGTNTDSGSGSDTKF